MIEVFVCFVLIGVINFSLQHTHPIVIGIELLIFLTLSCVFLIFHRAIYSFCLFMVIVGGVLVVFAYTIAMVPYSGKVAPKSKLENVSNNKKNKIFTRGYSGEGISYVDFLKKFLDELYKNCGKVLTRYVYYIFRWFVLIILGIFLKLEVNNRVQNMFYRILYYRIDFAKLRVWLGVLLFAVIVFSASLTSKNEGALVG